MNKARVALGALGIVAILYGAVELLHDSANTRPPALLEWLVGALILHDGVLVPVVTGVGLVLARVVPDRARGYLQGFLVVAGVVVLLVLALNHRHGHGQPGNALLTRDYVRDGGIVIALVAAVTAIAYAVRVLRDRSVS